MIYHHGHLVDFSTGDHACPFPPSGIAGIICTHIIERKSKDKDWNLRLMLSNAVTDITDTLHQSRSLYKNGSNITWECRVQSAGFSLHAVACVVCCSVLYLKVTRMAESHILSWLLSTSVWMRRWMFLDLSYITIQKGNFFKTKPFILPCRHMDDY